MTYTARSFAGVVAGLPMDPDDVANAIVMEKHVLVIKNRGEIGYRLASKEDWKYLKENCLTMDTRIRYDFMEVRLRIPSNETYQIEEDLMLPRGIVFVELHRIATSLTEFMGYWNYTYAPESTGASVMVPMVSERQI